ncbi:MAG: hypothetical protein ACP5M0_15860 [Desulfomonilaceae bacterium]
MRLTAKAFVVFVLMLLACEQAFPAGYEQPPPPRPQSFQSAGQSRADASLLAAIKEATFADRCVSYLDQAAVFVKDLLEQFGLGSHTNK